MKADIKKKVEIGLCAVNLIAFILVNLLELRTFHWVLTAFMAVPLFISIFCVVKNTYVDWEKKSPSILPLLISFCVYIVSSCIIRIPVLTDLIYVIFFIISFLSTITSIVFFIRFMIVYNAAYGKHRKEMELDKRQRLYNVSVPVLYAFVLLCVWMVTISFLDKIATVKSPEKYDKVVSDSNYEFFPDSLPENALNEELYQFPGFWLAKSKAYVKFETTKEFLDEYELMHGSDATKVTSIDAWLQFHGESSAICKRVNDDYLNRDNCDVYIKQEGYSIQGYAVNRDTNEIFIFYDGFD